MTMRQLSLVAMCLAGLVWHLPAESEVYRYVGNNYELFFGAGPYNSSMKVSATLELAAPLAANLIAAEVSPISFSFNDGVNTITNRSNLRTQSSRFWTDASGTINFWDIGAQTAFPFPSDVGDQRWEIGSMNTPAGDQADFGVIETCALDPSCGLLSVVSGQTRGDPGSWALGPLLSAADIVIDFGAIGLWSRMNDAVWLKLSNSSPDRMVTGDVDGNGEDDVIADFGSTLGGIFIKRNLGGWTQLHNINAELMATGDLDNSGKDDVVVDFGGIGLWARMNDANWLKLHNVSPDQVVAGDMDGNGADDVIAVFSSGIFVKRNLGGWSQLHNFVPEMMAVGDLDKSGKDDVVIDFGAIALWARMNDASWLKLHNSSPELIATGDLDGTRADDVLATFSGVGLWQKLNLGGWTVLSNSAADAVVTGDVTGNGQDDVVADFGSTIGGIFVRRDRGAWEKLHNTSPDSMAPGALD